VALATATELAIVSLPDALELVLFLVNDPRRFRRAALRWHARYCAEVPDVKFEEAHAVLACLPAWRVGGRRLRRLRWPSLFMAWARGGRARRWSDGRAGAGPIRKRAAFATTKRWKA
jgi:hypothetical protein